MFYFYCPKCKYEKDEIKQVPKGTVGNPRDGWGQPIHHYKCPNCGNLDAGYMRIIYNTQDEKFYYQHIIGMYQNIRSKN